MLQALRLRLMQVRLLTQALLPPPGPVRTARIVANGKDAPAT